MSTELHEMNEAGEPWALRSRLLDEAGFQHAFFTRLGGVSRPPFDSLNFAVSVGDDAEAVAENVRRAARALGIEARRLYVISQVHGRAFQLLDGVDDREVVARRVGDITIAKTSGVGCGVRTADCVPVLIGDRRTGNVAAVHSGWRGTADGVATVGVEALIELIGAGRGAIGEEPALVAAIGPHIEECCFEVSDEVAAELARASTLGEAAVLRQPGEAKPRVNLRAIVRAQLEAACIAPSSIDDVRGCTACDPRRFHSYRRDHDRSGRMVSVIVARSASAG